MQILFLLVTIFVNKMKANPGVGSHGAIPGQQLSGVIFGHSTFQCLKK